MLVERPLWNLYAGGVLWDRNVGGKALLNLRVLWEKILYEKCKQANRGNLTYYSPLHSERGWGWGLCELCMPEAFCGFETVRKKILLSLWVLWEKILYEMCKQANRGNLTYYSPLHSERGLGVRSLCALSEKNLSTISPHVLPDWRRALTTFQNMPFLHAEHALLAPRRVCSWRMYITSWFLVGYKLD